MSLNSKLGPKLGLCVIIAGLFLIGWAARYSAAQNPAQDPPPALPGPTTPTAKAEPEKIAAPPATPETRSEVGSTLPEPGPADSVAVPSLKSDSPLDQAAALETKATAPYTVASGTAPVEMDDPEKTATAFLEQNQKLAETNLKALKEEAEKLKARLAKVEAGVRRWERLLEAPLKQSEGDLGADSPPARVSSVVIPGESPVSKKSVILPAEDPTELSPVSGAPVPIAPK